MTYFKNIIGLVFITIAYIIFCIGRCFRPRPATIQPIVQDSPTLEILSPYFFENVNLPE